MSIKKDGHLSWTTQIDDLFSETMLKQERKGNKLDRGFLTTAYDMVNELNEKLPTIGFTKQNLKN